MSNSILQDDKNLADNFKILKTMLDEKRAQFIVKKKKEEGNPVFIKTCTGCNKKFPATKKYFYKEGNSDGLRAKCKECTRGYNKL